MPVTLKGARLNVATLSIPLVIVGSESDASVYVDRSTTAGSRTSYRKTVAVTVTGP